LQKQNLDGSTRAATIYFCRQGSHSGSHFAGAPLLLLPPLSNSQYLAKNQALSALPPVAALSTIILSLNDKSNSTFVSNLKNNIIE
jgi:hypothetical protein